MSNENHSAFPRSYDTHQDHCGLTKLEYFTAAAMQGLAARHGMEHYNPNDALVIAKATLSELSKEVGK